jgi:hypothetical protein
MKITKNLTWEPNFNNQIETEHKTFILTINKKEVEINCNWDYGWAGRGSETMVLGLEELKQLINEIENS